jgi:hypothetical protein
MTIGLRRDDLKKGLEFVFRLHENHGNVKVGEFR